MERWRKTFLGPEGTISDAIRIIEEGGVQICLVVDGDQRLMGTVTDGDIRRALLRVQPLTAPVAEAMKSQPLYGRPDELPEALVATMNAAQVRQLPLCDASRRVVGLVTLDELIKVSATRDNWVVLMAGGMGKRLRPLTENIPKPLLKVGRKPLLETILETFLVHGFRKFYLSVNYKAEMLKEHFGDGSRWDCTIRYLQEEERLGTAGALGLIPETSTAPLIVMNGDLLTKVNFASLVEFHREQGSLATMCVREYDFQVPYGVVEIADNRITGLVEKPVHSFFVNAGIYVVDPAILHMVPKGFFDMTDLFTAVIEQDKPTAVFPIREYWLDIGQPDDFTRANGEFAAIFD